MHNTCTSNFFASNYFKFSRLVAHSPERVVGWVFIRLVNGIIAVVPSFKKKKLEIQIVAKSNFAHNCVIDFCSGIKWRTAEIIAIFGPLGIILLHITFTKFNLVIYFSEGCWLYRNIRINALDNENMTINYGCSIFSVCYQNMIIFTYLIISKIKRQLVENPEKLGK